MPPTIIITSRNFQHDMATLDFARLLANGKLKDLVPPPINLPANITPIPARINHGRWIADCPYCTGAEMVDPNDPVFYCLNYECTRPHNTSPLPVQFPAGRVGLENALLRRPEMKNRNWFPNETIADLLAENAANGIN